MTSTSLPRLYLVTDRHNTAQRPLSLVINQAVDAGVRMVQIREKDMETRPLHDLLNSLIPLITHHQGIVLINDRIDLAMISEANGVHLRSDSLPLAQARRLLGNDKLIGISTHSMDDVRKAETNGADFIVLGPIFETPSKRRFGPPIGLDTLVAACQESQLPIYAIGGITPKQVPSVIASGAYGVAVISSILQAPDIRSRTQEFLSQLS